MFVRPVADKGCGQYRFDQFGGGTVCLSNQWQIGNLFDRIMECDSARPLFLAFLGPIGVGDIPADMINW